MSAEGSSSKPLNARDLRQLDEISRTPSVPYCAGHKAVEAVKQRFTRWVGWPSPMKGFQSHWCDVDAMAAHVVELESRVASLELQTDKLKPNAERYLFLKATDEGAVCAIAYRFKAACHGSQKADACIDRAIADPRKVR